LRRELRVVTLDSANRMAVAAGLVIIDSLFGLPGCEAMERLSFVRFIRVIRGSSISFGANKNDA